MPTAPGSKTIRFHRTNPAGAAFSELNERNVWLIHQILETAAADTNAPVGTPLREVGDFYAAAMDTNRLEGTEVSTH